MDCKSGTAKIQQFDNYPCSIGDIPALSGQTQCNSWSMLCTFGS